MSLRIYEKPLVITDSGGKDSLVCRELVRRAGIPYEVVHSLTTADAPETVYYVRDTFRSLEEQGVHCKIIKPMYKGKRTSMWSLIPMKKFPPTRLKRYCSQVLKEETVKDRFITTGVRWAESIKRKESRGIYENLTSDVRQKLILNNDNDERRALFESCTLKGKRVCNPVIDWTDRDVWDFIRSEHLKVNPLYERGFYRVGCIGCPMAGKRRWMEFRLYPTYKQAYLHAFDRMLEAMHKGESRVKWKNAQAVFDWWMEGHQIEGQLRLEDIDTWRQANHEIQEEENEQYEEEPKPWQHNL